MQELVILAHVPTASVNDGFIPAAQRLGLSVVLLTDEADAHRAHFNRGGLAAYPAEIVACDVFNPLAVIGLLAGRAKRPAAVFSNSDHLQTSTAIAADYFGLPRKDWHATYRAKNKAEMRAALQARGLDLLWHALVCDGQALARLEALPFPCIVKPREGVASQQVSLCHDRAALDALCTATWTAQPGLPLLLEEYIEGPLHTLETLGDGEQLRVLGGFEVTLSPPPYFVELEARWGSGVDAAGEARVVEMIRALGIGFGACHTEFVMTGAGPRLIEINYRNIGDGREFLLQDTLGIPLFETVLRLYLGEPLPPLVLKPDAAQIRYFTAQQAGRLSALPPDFAECANGMQISFSQLRAAGDAVVPPRSNKDYLGILRGHGPDRQLLEREMDRIGSALSWGIAA